MKERKVFNVDDDVSTEIVCILDRSGSMSPIADDTIGSFNTFLKQQQELPGKATMSMVLFDTEYEVLYDGVDINCVKPLTSKKYAPTGMTALYDAIGTALSKLENRHKCDKSKVLITIITDGQENSSKEYKNKCDILKYVEKCKEKYGWEFLYLSASPSAFADGASIGIGKQHTFTFQHSGHGMGQMMASYGCSATSYRSSGNLGNHFKNN